VRRTLRRWLRTRHDRHLDEWVYRSVPPRVLAEQDLSVEGHAPPADYKVFVLNGRAHFVQLFVGRGTRLRRAMLDRDWNLMPVWRGVRPGSRPEVIGAGDVPGRPERLTDLLEATERLAAPFPFVRVDAYLIGSDIYFGEMTFMPAGCYVSFEPRSFDRHLGSELTLPLAHTLVGTP
jgi:hypothetical protein